MIADVNKINVLNLYQRSVGNSFKELMCQARKNISMHSSREGPGDILTSAAGTLKS